MTREKVKPLHINTLIFKGEKLELLLDEHHAPAIKYQNQIYRILADFTKALPELTQTSHLGTLAEICNFMFKGLEFQFIKNIEDYKKMYHEKIAYEETKFELDMDRLSAFGIFDVSVMHPPRIVNHQLIFFVQNDYNHPPFRTVCELPLSREYPSVRYELLPYVHGR